FRKKLYRSVEELQTDLDVWLAKYNAQRPHSGRYCYGKTPVRTFRETLHIAVDKTVSASEPADSRHPILGDGS
ncbi:MAG: IS481 family transposase, partial [Rhodobacteraceae bacterium]|nr:IS481 family transposase [Paracoccaceae bacterium]